MSLYSISCVDCWLTVNLSEITAGSPMVRTPITKSEDWSTRWGVPDELLHSHSCMHALLVRDAVRCQTGQALKSHHWQSRSQTHLQSGYRPYYCCCNHPGWPHFHCRTSPSPTARLIPGQRQHSVLPVWHIHTPAVDRPRRLLWCPRSHHRQSATDHCGTLPHGLPTGFCHQQDECQRNLEYIGTKQMAENNII